MTFLRITENNYFGFFFTGKASTLSLKVVFDLFASLGNMF